MVERYLGPVNAGYDDDSIRREVATLLAGLEMDELNAETGLADTPIAKTVIESAAVDEHKPELAEHSFPENMLSRRQLFRLKDEEVIVIPKPTQALRRSRRRLVAAGVPLLLVTVLARGYIANNFQAEITTSSGDLAPVPTTDFLPTTSTAVAETTAEVARIVPSTIGAIILPVSPENSKQAAKEAATTTTTTTVTTTPPTEAAKISTTDDTATTEASVPVSTELPIDPDTIESTVTSPAVVLSPLQEIQAHIYDAVDCAADSTEIVPNGFFGSLASHCGMTTNTLSSYNPQFKNIENLLPGTKVWLHKNHGAGATTGANQAKVYATLENCGAHGGTITAIPQNFTVRQYLIDLGLDTVSADKIGGDVTVYFGLQTLIAGNNYCLPTRAGITTLWGI